MSEPARLTLPTPIIRRATDADVLPMAKVHILCWRQTYPGMLPDPMLARLSVADEAIRWQRTLNRPRTLRVTLAFVADQQGTIVGYGSCRQQRTELLHQRGFTGEVSELYVLRDSQRQGIGTRLMNAMASALIESGHCGMSLWVLAQNRAARRFYESAGGRLVAEKRASLIEVAYGWSDLRALSVGRDN